MEYFRLEKTEGGHLVQHLQSLIQGVVDIVICFLNEVDQTAKI